MRRTWSICNNKILNNLYDSVWNDLSLNYDLEDCPDLYLNTSKPIGNLGLFTYDETNYPIIVINEEFTNHPEKALNTILHEFCHYIANTKYRCNCNHNSKWKEIALEVGKKYGEVISIYCDDNDEVLNACRSQKAKRKAILPKIEIKCEKCNQSFIYKKKTWWMMPEGNCKATCLCGAKQLRWRYI